MSRHSRPLTGLQIELLELMERGFSVQESAARMGKGDHCTYKRACSLRRRGYVENRGGHLFITPQGRAALCKLRVASA